MSSLKGLNLLDIPETRGKDTALMLSSQLPNHSSILKTTFKSGMMQYSFKLEIMKRKDDSSDQESYITIASRRWYDRIFRTAVAVIWVMEELKNKVRGKED